MTLGSATYTAATLVQTLKGLADALDAAASAKASWEDALTKLADARSKVGPLVGDYEDWVRVTYKGTPTMLADYGVAPRKTRAPLTAEQKAAAAQKRKATRAARHTMGSKQKKDVKGDVTGITITPVTAANPVVKATNSPTVGTTSPTVGTTSPIATAATPRTGA